MNAMKAVNATLVCIAFAVATLAGCTGMHADVHAATPAAAFAGERTYTFAGPPTQEARADHAQFETVLRDELAKQGFADTAERPAHYVLSVGYETRPAQIGVGVSDCASGNCGPQTDASVSLFGARVYRHTLTLRFFERESGREVYKVSAASTDRDADPLRATPALIRSALVQFPFDAPTDWRVKLRPNPKGSLPEVVSVMPLQR
ncbi:DUF4136 domain-containing protein [Paraburkholderia caledonica]|uniref:DUF4136 domain-containing protein n=1 Tax=Paraburkholderia caledonica TaxID=134536 RepID=UPI000AA2C095|nr:DUF4136 domain-containing protein [Paraburkholderia caledonica]